MKKILAGLLAVVLVGALSGCGALSRVINELKENSTTSAVTEYSKSAVQSKPNVSVQPSIVSGSESVASVLEESDIPVESSSESDGGILGNIVDSLSFEGIYNDYAKQIEDIAAKCISEINYNKGDIDKIADISADGIDKMADLCAEGIDKMADRALLGASSYMEWSTKLTTLYTNKSTEVTNAYMSASMEGIFDGFDFDFNF